MPQVEKVDRNSLSGLEADEERVLEVLLGERHSSLQMSLYRTYLIGRNCDQYAVAELTSKKANIYFVDIERRTVKDKGSYESLKEVDEALEVDFPDYI